MTNPRSTVAVLLVLALSGCERFEVSNIPNVASAPPVIHTFTADATRLGPPNGAFLDTLLRWDVSGSTDTHCAIDSLGPPLQIVGNVPLGGVVQVRPQVSRDYKLSCTNGGGTVTRYVAIIVG